MLHAKQHIPVEWIALSILGEAYFQQITGAWNLSQEIGGDRLEGSECTMVEGYLRNMHQGTTILQERTPIVDYTIITPNALSTDRPELQKTYTGALCNKMGSVWSDLSAWSKYEVLPEDRLGGSSTNT